MVHQIFGHQPENSDEPQEAEPVPVGLLRYLSLTGREHEGAKGLSAAAGALPPGEVTMAL